MNTISHHDYMFSALQLAEQGRFTVSPNPRVGCIIVKNNRIIGRGFHKKAGDFHAEIYALKEAGAAAKDATAYVTLEPCCFQGRTPPCTNALIAAGINTVYIACNDPNPRVCGKGVEQLRAAGIEVKIGLCEAQAKQLNEIFFHFITTSTPFVIAKWAMSLDGKMVVNPGDTQQISNLESQRHTHLIRKEVDAILIGANTARVDNPQLTIRAIENPEMKQPFRIIMAGDQALPLNLIMFNDEFVAKTIIVTTAKNKNLFSNLNSKIELLIMPQDEQQCIALPALLRELAQRNIASLLVEGGRKVHESFFKENLVNRLHLYLSPTIIGSTHKKAIEKLTFSCLGDDFHFTTKILEANHF